MSKVKTYADVQNDLVKSFVSHNEFEGNTGHFALDASKLEFPKGVTTESIQTHQAFFNDITTAVEVAGAQLVRDQHAKDDKFITGRTSLRLGNMNFTSEHTLEKTVGDERYYGISTSIVDHSYAPAATEWLEDQRSRNEDLAKKLFS